MATGNERNKKQFVIIGFFEPRSITGEDADRTIQYRSDARRKTLAASITDMAAYLESLGMEAVISEFTTVDVPRLAHDPG